MIARVGTCRSSRGFTLIELIMVLVLVSALAVFVAPRLSGIADFNARGFHDETLALLRHAQKSAVAQRRPVCVVFGSAGATAHIDADRNTASGASGCEADLVGPRGETPAAVAARGSVQFASIPAVLVFDAQGRPSAAMTAQVDGASRQISVEAGTGFVHD
jgi:MSHA pilin protein MshC